MPPTRLNPAFRRPRWLQLRVRGRPLPRSLLHKRLRAGKLCPAPPQPAPAQQLRNQVPNQGAACCLTMGQSHSVPRCRLEGQGRRFCANVDVDQERAAGMCPVKFLQQHTPQERNHKRHKTFASSNTYLPKRRQPHSAPCSKKACWPDPFNAGGA